MFLRAGQKLLDKNHNEHCKLQQDRINVDKKVIQSTYLPEAVVHEQLAVLSKSADTGVFRIHCDAANAPLLNHPQNWLIVNPTMIGQKPESSITIEELLTLFTDDDNGTASLWVELLEDTHSVTKTTCIPTRHAEEFWLEIKLNFVKKTKQFSYIEGEIRRIGTKVIDPSSSESPDPSVEDILSHIPVALFKIDLKQQRNHSLPTAVPNSGWMRYGSQLYGLPEGSIRCPLDTQQYIHRDDLPLLQETLQNACLHQQRDYQVEFRIQCADKSERWLLSKNIIDYNHHQEPIALRGVQYDITDHKRELKQLEFLVGHDALTDLPNRALCLETLTRTAAAADRYNRKFAVMYVDLDRFKLINDTLGHDCGDRFLVEIAKRFRKNLRASEFISRIGGDEFIIIVDGINHIEQAKVVAEKLINLTILPVVIDEQEFRVTASIGVSFYPEDGIDEHSLLQHAEMAMYSAKESGKNTYELYDNKMSALSMERVDLETQLRDALDRNELSLLYQPKVGLKRDVITGLEALLRWNNEKLGFVSPMQFIPIAEQNGLIVPIGRWVLETACRQTRQWQRMGLKVVPIAVNVSARQFAEPDFYDDVLHALDQSGLAPSLLELEITEGMIMRDVDRTVQLLTDLKNLGVRVAIDDFGTGYSSLAQIRRFPIDTLKVDRSFVRNIHHDTEGQAITSAIFSMAKNLSLTVVAEGVETIDEACYLKSSTCDEMQGYYFSKPVDEEKIAHLLGQRVSGGIKK